MIRELLETEDDSVARAVEGIARNITRGYLHHLTTGQLRDLVIHAHNEFARLSREQGLTAAEIAARYPR